MNFARTLEVSCSPSGVLSQYFRVQEKRNPIPLMIQLVGSLSGAVPPDGGGGHLSALKRHKDGGNEPAKWAEDEGVIDNSQNNFYLYMQIFYIFVLIVIIFLLKDFIQ